MLTWYVSNSSLIWSQQEKHKARKSSPTHKKSWVQTMLLGFLIFFQTLHWECSNYQVCTFSADFNSIYTFTFQALKRDSHLLFMCCQSILLDGWAVFLSPGSGVAAGQRGASGGRTRGSEREGWGCWGVGGWTSTDPSEVGATRMMAAVLEVGKFLWQKKGGRFGTKRRYSMNEQSPTLTNHGKY